MDGYETCKRLKSNRITEHIPVIFVTIKDDSISLRKAYESGGVDYIPKPFEREEVLARVESHLKISSLTSELMHKNKELEDEISGRKQAEESRQQAFDALQIISQHEASRWGIEAFIGKSKTIGKILDEVRLLQNAGKTGVLIIGESGTGKELVARAIHFGGVKSTGPFITVNCSAITRELAESTLFGHIRGAFSGANAYHKGYFEQANGGTLFLDEIGDMPLELQPKLLRVIEDGIITPVGSEREKHVNVRILAATNQDLRKKIAEGLFRRDLYYRLENYQVEVLPLRERREDIPLLVEHFLKIFSEGMGMAAPPVSPEAMLALEDYQYPGNVRELRNIIERALIKSGGSMIRPEHLQFIDVNNAQCTSPQGSANISMTDEERILVCVQRNGSITNAECRELLSVDMRRASYLLEKMTDHGLLQRKSNRRWTRYFIPVH